MEASGSGRGPTHQKRYAETLGNNLCSQKVNCLIKYNLLSAFL